MFFNIVLHVYRYTNYTIKFDQRRAFHHSFQTNLVKLHYHLMADDLGAQQEYIEYLELREVWKNIGLSLEKEELEKWRTEFPVNIAVLDSGVKGDHEAFRSSRHPQPKVLKSFVMKNGERLNDNSDDKDLGHGTFCAGVATGYPIPSPKKVKDYKIQKLAETFSKLQQLPDGSRKVVEDIFDVLSGGDVEVLPFVGVAPFANVISYKSLIIMIM